MHQPLLRSVRTLSLLIQKPGVERTDYWQIVAQGLHPKQLKAAVHALRTARQKAGDIISSPQLKIKDLLDGLAKALGGTSFAHWVHQSLPELVRFLDRHGMFQPADLITWEHPPFGQPLTARAIADRFFAPGMPMPATLLTGVGSQLFAARGYGAIDLQAAVARLTGERNSLPGASEIKARLHFARGVWRDRRFDARHRHRARRPLLQPPAHVRRFPRGRRSVSREASSCVHRHLKGDADVQVVPVAVDGKVVELAVELVGSGPRLIVFLHEGLGSLASWGDWPRVLCAATGCRGMVYSRYGYGRSSTRPAGEPWPHDYLDIEARAYLPALLHALGIDALRDPPILFGHSDGATIALQYAAAFAHAVAAVIVLAPHLFVEAVARTRIAQLRERWGDGRLRTRLAQLHDDPDGVFMGWSGCWLDPAF